MGVLLSHGSKVARRAVSEADLDAAQALRFRAFVASDADGRDADPWDAVSDHVLIEEDGRLLATFRYQLFDDAASASQGYTGHRYDLASLEGLGGPLLEVGRFCSAPEAHDPDLVRLAWGAMTRIVDDAGATVLFGCSSFKGTDPAPYEAAFSLLAARHLAPTGQGPSRKAPETLDLPRAALCSDAHKQMPPLLRTYLMMGGWVSDHLVVDREMNTLHVFTAVEVDKIPPARAKALRALVPPQG